MPVRTALVMVLALVGLSGCGFAPGMSPTNTISGQAQALGKVPTDRKSFIAAVARLGLKMTSEQVDLVARERAAAPSGEWAPRPAVNLSAEGNLEVHFQKHRRELVPQPTTADEYLARAMKHASGKGTPIVYLFDVQSFDKGYQSHVVRWSSKSHELSAMRVDGAMTTYYLDSKMSSTRFVEVPASL